LRCGQIALRIGFGAFSVLFLTVVFVVSGLAVLFAPSGPTLPTPSTSPTPPAQTDFPAPNVQAVSPHYLPNSQGNVSRLYLVSATPSYGYYKLEPQNTPISSHGYYPIHQGDPCFIVDVTIRNDYDQENWLWPYYSGQTYPSVDAYFTLYARIYDANGLVNAPTVTPPYPSWRLVPEFYQGNGTTDSYELYFATGSRNITRYEIYLGYVASLPAP